jgi:hypothetical protein
MMSQAIVNDLQEQFQRTFRMLYEEIDRFDDKQWLTGIDDFLVPVKVAMHIVDCLDYYFFGSPGLRPAPQCTPSRRAIGFSCLPRSAWRQLGVGAG